ncbi:MAG: ParB/RepB/Spo0J family partition protein [Armatimonadetes bacterium]|nr:ParB/RepB/Spo0J family partition protein [Armatimonadota bacterium]
MRRVLGKGLSQLMAEQQEEVSIQQLPIDRLVPNERQPRKDFAEEPLQELADSIERVGIMQPIVVRPLDHGRYEIIAGERRWRAASLAGLDEVPVVIRNANSSEALQLALIENIQREDISALECALAYQSLIDEHGLTQEDLAKRVGKSRPSVANAIRLLRLPLEIREALASGAISEGHAKALLQFDTESEQLIVHRQIRERGLSVRDVESLAKGRRVTVKTHPRRESVESPLDRAVSEYFGSPSKVKQNGHGGKIEIEFYDEDDLARILDILDIRI